jgi:hypothetical protein
MILLGVLASAGAAAAVEKGQIGIDAEAGDRRLIGVRYHIGDSTALRAGVFFQRVKAENTLTLLDPSVPPPVFETTDTSVGGQLELDYYLRPTRDLTPYLAAITSYSRVNTPYPLAENDELLFRNGTLNNWSIGAGFGAQYAFSRSFQAFGRIGLSYASNERFTVNGVKLHSHVLSTSTSALGVAFYIR